MEIYFKNLRLKGKMPNLIDNQTSKSNKAITKQEITKQEP
jgi:hypothetical protein